MSTGISCGFTDLRFDRVNYSPLSALGYKNEIVLYKNTLTL